MKKIGWQHAETFSSCVCEIVFLVVFVVVSCWFVDRCGAVWGCHLRSTNKFVKMHFCDVLNFVDCPLCFQCSLHLKGAILVICRFYVRFVFCIEF